MTAAARLNYLTAYRLQRLGARVPLRTDAGAPLAVWAAYCAAQDARRPDPLTSSVRARSGARSLARGLGLRLRLRLSLPFPLPPAAGPAAPVLEGLPAPATAQAHPPAQPDPSPSSDSCPCDACGGSGRVPVSAFVFPRSDNCYFCTQCGGSGLLYLDPEPEPTPAKLLALSLADCFQAIDAFYHCQVSGAADLHAALKLSAQRARKTLTDTGYPLSRWPF